jgi:hypothetical protein
MPQASCSNSLRYNPLLSKLVMVFIFGFKNRQ